MRDKSNRATRVGILLGSLLAAPLAASEIYHWVDANGVHNYSQWAPSEAIDGVSRQIIVDADPPDRDPDEDLYAVDATAKQMQALWDEIEQRREQQRQPPPQAIDRVEAQQQEPYYALPGWYGRPVNRPGNKPGNRPPRPPELPEELPATSTLKRPG
ncbi:MAG TPA: DUF4124 domain-containing protein [Xanthomonadales bacterium]|nr:DUF4124 domain-containing protein [Xanthomonadales bacterium]